MISKGAARPGWRAAPKMNRYACSSNDGCARRRANSIELSPEQLERLNNLPPAPLPSSVTR